LQRQQGDERRHQSAVGELAPDEHAKRGTDTVQQQHPGNVSRIEAGDFGEQWRDVGVRHELAEHQHQHEDQRGPHLLAPQYHHFAPQPGGQACVSCSTRQEGDHRERCNDAQDEHRPEGGPPAESVTDGGAGRNADDVGDGEASQDQGDRHAALVLAHEPDRHDHGDAEIGTMCNGHCDTHQQHRSKIRRKRTGGLPGGEGEGKSEQQGLARSAGGGERQQRTADGDADRIAGNQVARGRNRDIQPIGHLRQHAGDDEFRRAKGKGREEQGEQGKRHRSYRQADGVGGIGHRPRTPLGSNP
jgi:hypothetical protein